MAYSNLPTWPLILFGILEPLALIWAYKMTIMNPFAFYEAQVPGNALSNFPPQGLSVTLQIGNVLLLLAAMALICCWTPHASVSRRYLIAVALADLGHIYASYRGMGPEAFWDVSGWNDMVWGNVGVSAFLHVQRWMTVLGLFGPLRS